MYTFDLISVQQFDSKSQASTQGDQHHDLHIFSHDNLQINPQDHNIQLQSVCKSKLKTSLCKNFIQKGFCPYGNKCQFAHGPEELKINNQINTSYKTKTCHAFIKKGYCQFGYRCNFKHQTLLIKNDLYSHIYDQDFKDLIKQSHFNLNIKKSKLSKIITMINY